ncbi:MAG TPA: hypothetical protein PK869_16610, partial [Candidatus Hydrogenedentes bacterium]|nr:hypothetical protein [Candidatus Hydrogenedentota bacterium]
MIRAIGIMFICCAAAFGRTPEGPLGPLRTPNDAQPVVALQGGNIDVTAVARGEVFLVAGDARIALEPQWVEYPDGVRAQCAIPLSTAPGAYALEWSSSDETDVTNRAVYVIEDHAESYTFACIDAVALAGDEDSVANTLQTVTDASCRFAFVFASGESAQMVEALRALEAWPIPTYFVVSTAPPDAAL